MARRQPIVWEMASLLAVVAVANLAYTMLIPLVPELRQRFAMGPLAIGAAFAGFPFAKALAQPAGGHLVDRTRPHRVAAFGLAVAALGMAGVGFARTGGQVVGSRLLWGAAEGIMMPALYRLAATVGRQRGVGEGRVLGWFGSSAVLGMAAGPAVVGSLHTVVGFRGIFLIAAGAAGVAAVLTRALRGAAAPPVRPSEDRPTGTANLAAGGIRLALATVALFGTLDLLNNFLYGALEPTLPLHLQHRFGNGVSITSGLFTAGLLVFALVSARAGRLVERSSPLALSELGLLVAAAALAVLGVARHLWMVGAAFLVFMGTQSILYVCSRRQVAALPPERQGRAFGFFGTISDAGFVIGPVAGTYLLSHSGSHAFAALAVVACCGAGALVVAARGLARQEEFRRIGASPASTEVSR